MYYRSMPYIFDDCTLRTIETKNTRHVIDLTKDKTGYGIVYASTPLSQCLENNETRKGQEGRTYVPRHLIEKMDEKFQMPNTSPKQYKFENNTFVCAWKKWDENALGKFILDSFSNVIASESDRSEGEQDQKKYDHEQTLKSLRHQVDISLRKIISKYMKLFKEQTWPLDQHTWFQNLQVFRERTLYDVRSLKVVDQSEMHILVEAVQNEFEEMVESYANLIRS
ncbi:hypothetical protein RFI_10351 [Reticulomyxa filosa]|uniref:Uncharacterized protein n=1 Tax=Reticulomyxa filosa TaxID=46433 RepID=X6NLJ6_RETFI|nr:hypothetical protein RFI_10351 [Reticulomyxa filosa]|eukprot:ETO26783.1 hypothetical protein RFI_10351 [Reticulomyxa filosa]